MSRLNDWDERCPWDALKARQYASAAAAARRAGVVPAYRVEWARVGIAAGEINESNWPALPLLSKDALVAGAAAEPPYGGRLGVDRRELAHVFVAPGPLYMPFTAVDFDHLAGSFAKAFLSCGLERGDLVDQTTMYNWVIAATALDRALAQIGCAAVPGGVGQTERHIEVIQRLGVDAVLGFPTFVEHLLATAAAAGQALPLRKAVVMGELSHPDAKARLHAVHGVAAREFYGAADVGAIAYECSAGDGMHLRDDLLVEFVRPGEDAMEEPASGRVAELVVTDFRRRAMPIIRLRTGDLIDEIVTGPCACGRTAPRLRRIVGRAGEITKVKGMFVIPRQVADVLQRRGVDRPFRLIVDRLEERDRLTLVIAGPVLDGSDALKALIEQALRLRIELAFVDSLPETGKRLEDRRAVARAC